MTGIFLFVFMFSENAVAESEIIHSVPQAKGVVVLVHGLNISQSSLSELIQLFNEADFSVVSLVLSGHTKETFHDASIDRWKDEYVHALQAAKNLVADKPIFICGFSLGAALTVLTGNQGFPVKISGIILLAPPLKLRSGYWLMRPLLHFSFLRIPIPSAASKTYRALSSLSMYTFKALFDVEEEIEGINDIPNDSNLRNIPVLAFIRDYDEFASSTEVTDWISKKNLTNWTIRTVDASQSSAPLTHILLDEKSFGANEWQHFREDVFQLLNGNTHR